MLYYTIREVAELLNVSVQAVYYRTKLKPKHHLYIQCIELAKNTYLVPKEEYERLKKTTN